MSAVVHALIVAQLAQLAVCVGVLAGYAVEWARRCQP